MKLYLEKFPVVSSKGNEYFVSIHDHEIFGESVGCRVYTRVIKKTFFGREKVVFSYLWGRGRHFEERKWNYDYIEMAKHGVEDYESHLDSIRQHEENRKLGIEAFVNWNGKVGE